MLIEQGDLRARRAGGPEDRAALGRLRHEAWAGAAFDPWDDLAEHLFFESRAGTLLAALRVLPLADGAQIDRSYSARFYDLAGFRMLRTPLLEAGRFSLAREGDVPVWAVLRLLWAALARLVAQSGATHVIGCSSFIGADPARHAQAFLYLRDHHQGRGGLAPRVRADDVMRFCDLGAGGGDVALGRAALAPLLRFYLGLGAWVSDHAVIDMGLDTTHVFTCVEVAQLAPARARALQRGTTGGAPCLGTCHEAP